MRDVAPVEFEWVFRSSYSSVLRTVFLVLHDRGRAEEVTQDAFLKLCERWRGVARIDSPEAWVRTVAVRAAIRQARRNERIVLSAVADRAEPGDHLPDVDLARAVAVLPVRQRAAVVLFYLEDLSVQDVAAVLRVSTSTVKQHLHRARAALAVSLAEPLDEGHPEGAKRDVG